MASGGAARTRVSSAYWTSIRRRLLPDSLPRARYFGMAIKEDKSGFFYSRYTTDQGSRVYYHAMGKPLSEDREIFGKGHGPDAIIGAELSEDGRYLLIYVDIGVPPKKVEVWTQDIAAGGPIQPVVTDVDAEFKPFIRGDGCIYGLTGTLPTGAF